MSTDDREIVQELVTAGLVTDGAHHKQWFLEQIAFQLELSVPDHDPGMPP